MKSKNGWSSYRVFTCLAALIVLGLAGSGPSLQAQTNPQAGPALLNPPPIAPQFPTNQLAGLASLSTVGQFALNLLPAWDKGASCFTNAHELEFEVSPTWKSATASGSTPYLSIGADYMFARHWGAGMDLITLGNGTGSSDIDSAHAFFIGRADAGNIAGHVLLGGGRSLNRNQFCFEGGGGLEYRYTTGVGILVDTRYVTYFNTGAGSKVGDHEFLTRVGVTIHF